MTLNKFKYIREGVLEGYKKVLERIIVLLIISCFTSILGANAATPINNCGFSITQPGTYYLTSNLLSNNGDCITVSNTSNVVIRGNGYTIKGTQSPPNQTGILISSGSENVLIDKLTISNFFNGVMISALRTGPIIYDYLPGIHIKNTKFLGNSIGIQARGADGLVIENNLFQRSTSFGLTLLTANNTKLIGNIFKGNFIGADLQGAFFSIVKSNAFIRNSVAGLRVTSHTILPSGGSSGPANGQLGEFGTLIEENKFVQNTLGADLDSEDYTLLVGNQFARNQQDYSSSGLPYFLVQNSPFLINSCQDITAPGLYRLTGNLSLSPGRTECLNILSDMVFLDGNGFTVSNTNNLTRSTGIHALNHYHIFLTNMKLKGFNTQINLEGVQFFALDGLNLIDNSKAAINLDQSGGGRVYGNKISRSSVAGILLKNPEEIRIISNTITESSQAAISISGPTGQIYLPSLSPGNQIRHNSIKGASKGIKAKHVNLQIHKNEIYNSSQNAIELTDTLAVTVEENMISDGPTGIFLQDTRDTIIENNTVNDLDYGVKANRSPYTKIYSNFFQQITRADVCVDLTTLADTEFKSTISNGSNYAWKGSNLGSGPNLSFAVSVAPYTGLMPLTYEAIYIIPQIPSTPARYIVSTSANNPTTGLPSLQASFTLEVN